MRLSKRLIKAAIELAYYRSIHGVYCKMCASPEDCPKPIELECHYEHIDASDIISEFERKVKRIASR